MVIQLDMELYLKLYFSFSGKLASLICFLEARSVQKAMLFLPTCATVDYWSRVFPRILPKKLDLPVMAIHGKMKQKRNKVLESFRNASKALLLCTDVMARGIDIAEVRTEYLVAEQYRNCMLFIYLDGLGTAMGSSCKRKRFRS